MPRLSQTHRFLQSPSFRQVQSALIGQLTQCIVIGWTPHALVGIVTPLSIIASFSFQNKSTISSSPRGEQSHVRDTVMMLVCICTQAAIKTADSTVTLSLSHTHTSRDKDSWLAVMWPRLSLSHTRAHDTHTRRAKLRIWAVNSKYLN